MADNSDVFAAINAIVAHQNPIPFLKRLNRLRIYEVFLDRDQFQKLTTNPIVEPSYLQVMKAKRLKSPPDDELVFQFYDIKFIIKAPS